jgi:Fe-S-cluster-containing dehydrogenase component
MPKIYGILTDLDRCVGCQACEIACKQENNITKGTPWIQVIPLGPEEIDGTLYSDYYPVISPGNHFCRSRVEQGLEPFCVAICPTKALQFVDELGILAAIKSKKRYQISGIGRDASTSP